MFWSSSGGRRDDGVGAAATGIAVAVAAGIDLLINARTDTYLFGDGSGTLERAKVYAEAGAELLSTGTYETLATT